MAAHQKSEQVQILVERPPFFDDVSIGDSISHDGVCLTVEAIFDDSLQYTLGKETLQITNWNDSLLKGAELNLERSLRWGDRVHGHMVSGHVDGRAKTIRREAVGANLTLTLELPEAYEAFIWKKGSICLNGVSLTINQVEKCRFTVGLIPETLKRTNLSSLQAGDFVNFEVDQFARGLQRFFEFHNQISLPEKRA